MTKLDDKLKALAGDKPAEKGKLVKAAPQGAPGTGRGRSYVPNGKGRGGNRGGGRPPKEDELEKRGWKQKLEEFYDGEMTVQITDPKTGQARVVQKNRVYIALEKLFSKAVKGDGDTDALSKFLDRALGKPKQPLTGGDEGDEPIKHEVVGLGTILDKAYGDTDD